MTAGIRAVNFNGHSAPWVLPTWSLPLPRQRARSNAALAPSNAAWSHYWLMPKSALIRKPMKCFAWKSTARTQPNILPQTKCPQRCFVTPGATATQQCASVRLQPYLIYIFRYALLAGFTMITLSNLTDALTRSLQQPKNTSPSSFIPTPNFGFSKISQSFPGPLFLAIFRSEITVHF